MYTFNKTVGVSHQFEMSAITTRVTLRFIAHHSQGRVTSTFNLNNSI